MHDGPIEFVQFMRFIESLGDGWLAIVVLGILAGFLARLITTRKRNIGLVSTCLLGITGAVLGVTVAGWLGIALDGTGMRFLAAFAGSLVLVVLGGLFRSRSQKAA